MDTKTAAEKAIAKIDQSKLIVRVGSALFSGHPVADGKAIMKFKETVNGLAYNGGRVVIVAGGGELARLGDQILMEVNPNASEELRDRVGIEATRYNAKLLAWIFGIQNVLPRWVEGDFGNFSMAELESPGEIKIASGCKPGSSTDGVMVRLAKLWGAKTVIKVGTPVQELDPRNAVMLNPRVFHEITWKRYFDIVGHHRTPSIRLPIDPAAALDAQRNNINVVIGRLEYFDWPLDKFIKYGTVITPYEAIGTSQYTVNIMMKKAYAGSVLSYLQSCNPGVDPAALKVTIAMLENAWEIGFGGARCTQSREEFLEFICMARISGPIEKAMFWLKAGGLGQAKEALARAIAAADKNKK